MHPPLQLGGRGSGVKNFTKIFARGGSELFILVGGLDMFKKKVALCDIAKTEKSKIFVLLENEASYGDFFMKTYEVMLWILCVTFSVKI